MYAIHRSLQDDFNKPLTAWSVPRDPNPQWCHLVWNGDASLLAVADSCGAVTVYDMMGSPVATVNKVLHNIYKLHFVK